MEKKINPMVSYCLVTSDKGNKISSREIPQNLKREFVNSFLKTTPTIDEFNSWLLSNGAVPS